MVSGRVKQLTYTIDICFSLAWRLALLRSGKNWLAQCQDNVTEWGVSDNGLGSHEVVRTVLWLSYEPLFNKCSMAQSLRQF